MKKINVNFSVALRELHGIEYLGALLNEAIEELKSGKIINISISRNDIDEVKKMTYFELLEDNYEFLKKFSKGAGMSITSLVNYLIKYKLR